MPHLCIYIPHIYVRYLAYMAYIHNLVGIFVSGTYLAITAEVEVVAGCVLVYMCTNVGSIFPFSMLVS